MPPEASNPDVVAIIAGRPLTLAEFEQQYIRTIGDAAAAAADSLEAYEDFLERYVDFLIKVEAARDAGLHEDSTLQAEILAYRTQLGRPYLVEQEIMEPMIQEMYDRQRQMVEASHILIRVAPDALPRDTLAAYNRIQDLAESIADGADFGELAFQFSEDPSAKQGSPGTPGYQGYLGYFTGGRMVKSFEDAAYETPPGTVSAPIRTQFGYHLIEVHDRREAIPDVKVAHVLIQFGGSTPADSAAARAEAQQVSEGLAQGFTFAQMARQFSDDQRTSQTGGELGYLNYASGLLPAIRDAVFSLENIGDVTGPLETRFGIHFFQLKDRRTQQTYEEAYEEIKNSISRMPRAQRAETAFATQVRQRAGVTVDSALVRTIYADTVYRDLNRGTVAPSLQGRAFATLGDSVYTFDDLQVYIAANRMPQSPLNVEKFFGSIDGFLNDQAIAYEAASLEARDEEFRATMDEFRRGLLLFKLMEDSVWTRAAEDSAALLAHYEAHATDYQFDDRVRAISYISPVDSFLASLGQRYDNGETIAQINASLAADSIRNFRHDTTYVADRTQSAYDLVLDLEPGQRTEPTFNNRGYILLIHDGVEPARQKTFEEAKTQVINEYQEILEDALVARLREKYRVFVFPERLTRAFADEASGTAAAG